MTPPVLVIPGWQDSGPAHWQSLWQRDNPRWQRVVQTEWNHPSVDDWTATIDRAIRACAEPPLLVGHSLGCIAIARWARHFDAAVRGAFLVAPADVEAATAPPEIATFAPIHRLRLPFPSLVVASRNDGYATLAKAQAMADAWGSAFVDLGEAGHINAEAGFGAWPEGRRLLARFIETTAAARRHDLA